MKKLVIGILAHVDAGKTTLSEAMLYTCGTLKKLGRVDHRDAFLDTHAIERERGITIFSKQAVMAFGQSEITLLDTPGHVDFGAEMERTLQVLDCAVLVVSGSEGVQGHTQTLWRLLEQYAIPTCYYIFGKGHGIPAMSFSISLPKLLEWVSNGLAFLSMDFASEVKSVSHPLIRSSSIYAGRTSRSCHQTD